MQFARQAYLMYLNELIQDLESPRNTYLYPRYGGQTPPILKISISEEYSESHRKVVDTKVVGLEKLTSGNCYCSKIYP